MLRDAWLYGLALAVLAAGGVGRDVRADPPKAEPAAVSTAWLDDVPPMSFHVVKSAHFRLLIDADARQANVKTITHVLEVTHDDFFTAFPTDRFDHQALAGPAMWVCFQAPKRFDRYARLADRRDMSHLRGYYSARTNRVALLLDDQPVATTAHSSRTTGSQRDDQPVTLEPRRIAQEGTSVCRWRS